MTTPIVLASISPRRKELLANLGLAFTIIDPAITEKRKRGETPKDYVQRNALTKAQVVWQQLLLKTSQTENLVVIAADTIVYFQDKVLEKPASSQQALQMLKSIQGNKHEVLTGFCVLGKIQGKYLQKTKISKSQVWMRTLTLDEIRNYIATGEPMDKAGAYAIQGIGSSLVRRIRGSYTNVVGLPLAELCEVLKNDFHIKII